VPWHRFHGRSLLRQSAASCRHQSGGKPPHSEGPPASLWGGRRTAPYAFTEQGVAMLSSVLRSRRAIAVNVEVMRAFVRLREMIAEYAHLRRRIDELEQRTDGQFEVVFDAIRALMDSETKPRRRIGYLSAGKGPASALAKTPRHAFRTPTRP
jgi:hypothetical protein